MCLADQIGGKLLRLEDNLNELLAAYLFYQTATFEVMANRQDHNSQLLLGLSLTGDWLAQRSKAVLTEMETLQACVKGQY